MIKSAKKPETNCNTIYSRVTNELKKKTLKEAERLGYGNIPSFVRELLIAYFKNNDKK